MAALFLTLTGKGSQCPKAWLWEPAVCLIHLWQAGLKRKQGFKEGRISSRKALLSALSFPIPVLTSLVSLSDVFRSSFPGICVRNSSPPGIAGLVLRWAQWVTPMKVVERTKKENRCLVVWAGRDGGTWWSGEAGGGGEACWDWRSGLWEESAVDLLWCAMGPDVICVIEKGVESRKCLVCITLL